MLIFGAKRIEFRSEKHSKPAHLIYFEEAFGRLENRGGYLEYVCANAQFCIPLPPQIDSGEAAGIFVQGSTAYLILHQVAKEFAGKSILIHEASGGVGSILVQLAKLGGAKKVIGAGSSDEKLSFARVVGADETKF